MPFSPAPWVTLLWPVLTVKNLVMCTIASDTGAQENDPRVKLHRSCGSSSPSPPNPIPEPSLCNAPVSQCRCLVYSNMTANEHGAVDGEGA
mmetsp:Transcript_71383/g.119451  ORF Transcript_71383/g.119451 Transcript_71383/m.119451 type:complete len:91 (+) Transcript_71383:1096-1368(+)